MTPEHHQQKKQTNKVNFKMETFALASMAQLVGGVLCTERLLPVPFLVRAHVWVASSTPGRRHAGGS